MRRESPVSSVPRIARKEALRLLGEHAKGNDPAAARDRVRRLPTLSEFATRYLEDHAKPHKKPRSYLEDKRKPRQDRHPRARAHPDRPAHPKRRYPLSSLKEEHPDEPQSVPSSPLPHDDHGREVGLPSRRHEPVSTLTKWKETKREKYLTPAELGRLAEALNTIEAEKPMEAAAIRLLVSPELAGARS